MLDMFAFARACRYRIAAIAIAGAMMAVAGSAAIGQVNVVVVVNGDPITAFDIEQRTRLNQIAGGGKVPSRQEVIDELIEEKLKLQLPKRFDFSGHSFDDDADNALNNMARNQHRTRAQFIEQLAAAGVHISTLKSRVKAAIIWQQVIRGKYQSSFQVPEGEILKKVESENKEDKAGFDYTLRPIMFVVPRGSPQSVFESRRREAEALRIRFQSCAEGIGFARALRDIAIREPVTRSSADLTPQLREILEKTEVGRLTPPETTQQGVELFAVCGKKLSAKDNTPGKREVRDEYISKQFQINSKKFMKELRDQAYIQYK